ncbi:hypothetical protein K2Q16_01825 [Patescibacteria group bacterium]|nr:hypothetical protein [Patescibacteria group bacterium]
MGATIRLTLVVLLILSIGVSYYVMVIKKDYDIITNPDGPITSDEA